MKALKIVAVAITMTVCAAFALNAQQQKSDSKNSEPVTFATSLHCESCKAKIEKNLAWEKGVKDLAINVETKEVTVTYDPQKTNPEALRKAIEKLGYTCSSQKDTDPKS